MVKIIGTVFTMLLCAGAGYIAYRFIPRIVENTYQWLEDKGPLGILLMIGIGLVEVLVAWVISLVAMNPFITENRRGIFALICAFIAGFPVIASLAVLFWQGKIGSFTGGMYVLVGAILMCAVFVFIFDCGKQNEK